ncbi:MAG: ATP-binding cassette domain-containing protein [Candidatus Ancillula sp.]|jgi:iron complex transport system ATP-binding protein|nr:ATP-binding cassette domain-containing protein [Candidatus Ancillula sp.]
MYEMLKLQDVKVVRNRNIIVQDINWTVNSGENWVLLGPNGVGKSTLINIIAARRFPTKGKVTILGSELGKIDVFKLRQKIGILSNDLDNAFPNSLSAHEIVFSAAKGMMGSWGDERDKNIFEQKDYDKAEELLIMFGAKKIINRPWGVLSQGERKRVQMARTLMTDPDLLLFDEPTAGLDLAGREYVINTLTRLSSYDRDEDRKRAVILVNHNVEEIPPSFDKIALMGYLNEQTGTILYQGDIRQNLTSEKLTHAYGISLDVTRQPNLRYFASTSVIVSN